MPSRRKFIQKVTWASSLIVLGKFPYAALATPKTVKITILHTNDTQSHIEPFAVDAPKHAGLGGVQARANLIQEIRAQEENVLLVDAGDFFQSSSYFEVFKGAVEIEVMNQMKYDAACLGEHEFDGGIENLSKQLSTAKWSILCCNYNFENESLRNMVKPYSIIEKAGIKFGLLAVGINLEGLVDEDIRKQIKFENPIEKAKEVAKHLKKKENCDFIICLSHLGLYNNNEPKFSDKNLAKETENIDLIIGGHAHTLLQKPLKFYNLKKQEVLVAQSGWGGSHLGRIDYIFSANKNILSSNVQTVEIGK